MRRRAAFLAVLAVCALVASRTCGDRGSLRSGPSALSRPEHGKAELPGTGASRRPRAGTRLKPDAGAPEDVGFDIDPIAFRAMRLDTQEHTARVQWPDGSAAPEAFVRLGELDDARPVAADPDGAYRSFVVSGDDDWNAAAVRDGAIWTARAVILGTGRCSVLTLEPPHGADRVIVVRVQGPDGSAVSEATVEVVGGECRAGPSRFMGGVTFVNGAILVRRLRWRSQPVFFIHSARDGAGPLPLGTATFAPDLDGAAEQRVTLPHDEGVRGRVVAPDGSPVAGARILVDRCDDPPGTTIPWDKLETSSDAEGAFHCRGVPARPAARIAARKDGRASGWEWASPGESGVVLTLSGGGIRFGVRVRDTGTAQRPVVTFPWGPASLREGGASISPRSPEDHAGPDAGVSWCELPPAFMATVEVTCEGHAPFRRSWVPHPDEILDVTLRPLRRLSVRVLDPGGRSLARAPVHVMSDQTDDRPVVTLVDGVFRVAGVGTGSRVEAVLQVGDEALDRAVWKDGEEEVTLRWPEDPSQFFVPVEPEPDAVSDRVMLVADGVVLAEADASAGVAAFGRSGLPEAVHVVRVTRRGGEYLAWTVRLLPAAAAHGVLSERLWPGSENLRLEFRGEEPIRTPVELTVSRAGGVSFTIDTEMDGVAFLSMPGGAEWRVRARTMDGRLTGEFTLDLRQDDVLNNPRQFRFTMTEAPK